MQLWLVRLPPSVAEALDRAEAGQEIGSLVLSGKGKALERQVRLLPYSAEALAPVNFCLAPTTAAQSDEGGKLYGFSTSSDRRHIRLEGAITHQYSLRPREGNLYDEFSRKRNEKALDLVRFTCKRRRKR